MIRQMWSVKSIANQKGCRIRLAAHPLGHAIQSIRNRAQVAGAFAPGECFRK